MITPPATAVAPAPAPGGSIRAMVVDDSAVIRGLIARLLESDPEIVVVGTAANGEMALAMLGRTAVDVIVLDIEMPVMDGLTALPLLLRAAPDARIIMASTLTKRNAEISIKALSAGAADYVAKPTTTKEIQATQEFRHELLAKVKALGANGRRRRRETGDVGRVGTPHRTAVDLATKHGTKREFRLRPATQRRPELIAIGSSTGGPQALMSTLASLPVSIDMPILITQHMPATFTSILAEHLARATGRPAAEASEGEPVKPGRIYVAPGDFHMTVAAEPGRRAIRLNKGPPENFCRPAVDPMFRSLARAYGAGVLGIILTGMGSDGALGARAVVDAGGIVIAQDEATSVVWGMPGAAAAAGVCSAVLPLPDIANYIRRLPA